MTPATAQYARLIERDALKRPCLSGTRYRISFLAAEHTHYRWTAEDLLANHPDLTPGQVDAALAYFYDHRAEIETELSETDQAWAAGRAESHQTPLVELKRRLRS